MIVSKVCRHTAAILNKERKRRKKEKREEKKGGRRKGCRRERVEGEKGGEPTERSARC